MEICAFFHLILGEEFEGVVSEVVGGVTGFSGAALIDLPTDSGFFETLGIGGPGIAIFLCALVEAGAVGLLTQDVLCVDGAGPEVDAIGCGVGVDGAVIGVAESEGIGECVVKGDVFALEIAHGDYILLLGDPLVVVAVVPGEVTAAPAVVGTGLEFCGVFGIEVEGQDVLGIRVKATVLIAVCFDGGYGLIPDRLTVGLELGAGIIESANSAERAEVVVEGTILLHEDDDVLDVLNGSGSAIGGDGEGARDGSWEQGCSCGGGGQAEEIASGGHGDDP